MMTVHKLQDNGPEYLLSKFSIVWFIVSDHPIFTQFELHINQLYFYFYETENNHQNMLVF